MHTGLKPHHSTLLDCSYDCEISAFLADYLRERAMALPADTLALKLAENIHQMYYYISSLLT